MFTTKTEEMTNFGQWVYSFVKAFIRDFLASSKNFLKKRWKIGRDNKAAKELFKEFEKGNFKDNFKSIIADKSFQPFRSYAFHFISFYNVCANMKSLKVNYRNNR